MHEQIDREYYESIRSGSVSERLFVAARKKMFEDLLRLAKPSDKSTILDVGVSDVQVRGANWLECVYPYQSQITACGLGEGNEFRKAFPMISYSRITPNETLPYSDEYFEIATANAVLEHLGSVENQKRFISELSRVAKAIFITVPHRYFPVEHHTSIPLLHFTNSTFGAACKFFGKSRWSKPENLILISRKHLRSVAPAGSIIGYTGLNLGPFSSNLFLFLQKN